MTVRKELYHAHPNVLPYTVQVNLEAGGEFYQALKAMQSSEDADESGLCELLQVSRVSLQKREEEGFTLQVNKSEKCKCLRCRKLTAIVGRELCSRCNEVVASNW
ncbi:hypothetical protein SK128_001179 [Halocaridina rubra]|uniref:Uncharacterized protein n=1 Tax=Halocaridina rubra TaxID=373956 RepID=A0AAN8WMG6_HALRR